MKRQTPALEDVEARRDRLLDALKTVLAAASRSVVHDGHEYKVIDPETLVEEFGFDRLQILNDLIDLVGLEEIAFGPQPLLTGEPGQCEREWVVRLL